DVRDRDVDVIDHATRPSTLRRPDERVRRTCELADATPDSEAVAERIGQGELAHAPRLILDWSNGQPVGGHARVPSVGVSDDQIATGTIARAVELHDIEVEHTLAVVVDEREAVTRINV